MGSKGAIIAVMVILIVVVVIYLVVLFIDYSNQSWIFAPYEPEVPSNACQPLIQISKLSPEDQEYRNQILTEALAQFNGGTAT